jgi:hypothetical protein
VSAQSWGGRPDNVNATVRQRQSIPSRTNDHRFTEGARTACCRYTATHKVLRQLPRSMRLISPHVPRPRLTPSWPPSPDTTSPWRTGRRFSLCGNRSADRRGRTTCATLPPALTPPATRRRHTIAAIGQTQSAGSNFRQTRARTAPPVFIDLDGKHAAILQNSRL